MTALFVTSTGTDVGRTFVACLIIRALRESGRAVRALKPIATGFDAARPEASDTGRLLSSLGRSIDAAALDAVSPWRFTAPLSPDMAAAREARPIDWQALIAFCRSEIAAAARDDAVVLIEGIGGVMVPLDQRRTVLDWIAELDVPALLVAGSYLGTLSHTLTAAAALASRGGRLAGIVVDESPQQPVSADETAAVLERFAAPAPIVVVPRTKMVSDTIFLEKVSDTIFRDAASAAARLVALLDSH